MKELRCRCGAPYPEVSPLEPLRRTCCESCGADLILSGFEKMDVALSERCNYKCIMCRRPPEEASLGLDEVTRVLGEAADLGLRVVSFCGGEPFVHKDFLSIAERAIALGLKVQLTTNGSLVTKAKLARLEGLDCMTVSIDALAATHDRIRGVPGAFDRAVETLRLAGQAGITCGTNTVIQRANAGELLPLFEHILKATDGRVDYVRHAPVEVVPETVELMVTEGEIQAVEEQLARIAEVCEEQDIYFSHRKQLLEHLHLFLDKWTRHRPHGGCQIPRKFIGYSHQGFYLCWHQGRAIRAASLIDALETETAQHIVTEAHKGRCVGCNALTYSWDEEWNEGILKGKLIHDGTLYDGTTTIHGEWGSRAEGS
jgi:sulfatase maturation enzyme AslB (radical SAM superfamily)